MYEHNNNPPSNDSTAQRQDAIDISDFVFAAKGGAGAEADDAGWGVLVSRGGRL
ncbi:hypothetical protein [Streptomyces sp. NBC_01538]|uniref:hypothetical protein n=1 Tax=Streptomyces sp. NBC_01538 TaxID=2903897 RepID=UPI00386B3AB1